jgi:outer membrane protein OmpA-like peptidoglycan-associated protein
MSYSMIRALVSIFFITTFFWIHAQTEREQSESIADCEGAVNLFKSGSYSIQFTGKPGFIDDLLNYPSLAEISGKNIVWISYIPDVDGILTFNASIGENYLQMVVFEEGASDICLELSKGTAEIKRIYNKKDQKVVGLDSTLSEGKLYPLELLAGQKILIALTTLEKSKSIVKFNFKFHSTYSSENEMKEPKVIDSRKDDFAPTISFIARDSATNMPVIANFIIEDSKELSGLYRCSDLLLNASRKCKIMVRCDAEGYFFKDKEVSITGTTDQEIVFFLDRIAKGKSMQIEEIQFKPGTSEIMPESESKLRRLKDFMALNSDVEIEIQGHVFYLGDNGFASQKLSESRAKRVMAYLVDNGINKKRLKAVGYGNTRPIYPKPKFAYEEQANRRVEILVK